MNAVIDWPEDLSLWCRMPTAEGVKKRVEEIRQEAMYALRLIGWGDFSTEEIESYEKELEAMREAQQNQTRSTGFSEPIDISDKDEEWIKKLTVPDTS